MLKDKGLIIGILATVILIAGGVFLMSRGGSSSPQSAKQISSDILVPKDAYVTAGIEVNSYLPASSSAKATLVEFGDYQCPACIEYHPLIKQLLTDFSGKMNFVFRNYPLSQHANAPITAYAVEAAGLQNKYWQMHDKVYESSGEWVTSADAKSILIGYAGEMGLDVEKFKSDIDSSVVKDRVQRDVGDGNLVNLNATPTFYLNGVKIENLKGSYQDLKNLINSEFQKTN